MKSKTIATRAPLPQRDSFDKGQTLQLWEARPWADGCQVSQ